MAVIGPGAQEISTENPKPLLWTATENDVVQVFNPLSDDFAARVAVSRTADMPFEVRPTPGLDGPTNNENDVQRNYGLNLKNRDHPAYMHVSTRVLLPAGQTINLQGNAAKVAVNQLVNEIMQREGNSIKMADPTARLEVEQRVVKGVRSVQDLMANAAVITPQQQVQQAIDNLNVNQGEANHETAFPTERGTSSPEANSRPESPEAELPRRSPGRPKKTQ